MMPAANILFKNWGVVLLAAGRSSRLGRPKQLLPYKGKSLLRHSLQVACATSAQTVVVVVGAAAAAVQQEGEGSRAQVVVNEAWQEGMAASIRQGIRELLRIQPGAEGVILMVCDQPFVTTALLHDILKTHQQTGQLMVASGYGNTAGPPVFFHQTLFSELLQLQGDTGARSLIRQHARDVEVVAFPEGHLDIDTEEDYQKLKGRNPL
ncbi:nucleotidyltransferase family protein [Paraflavisolibacter sp. H34]|uniref:nucleotidyltransferase family protein n=1 Tax=Huijunlia imazamoxiresistens TaxID=3127457 RepID=UPI00301AFE54